MLSMSFLVDIRYDILYNRNRIRVKAISRRRKKNGTD